MRNLALDLSLLLRRVATFRKSLQEIFTEESISNALNTYKFNQSYLEAKQVIDQESILQQILNGSYTPDAAKRFLLAKNDGSTRPIAVTNLIDRTIQKVIVNALQHEFTFSDKSYAYRQNKGPVKAINRVLDFIKRGNFWILRTDIHNFFESINQDILSNQLVSLIQDANLISLIALFYKNGIVTLKSYYDHSEGIHQGDPLSPLLSNIYLNPFDKFLEQEDINFVRYGDDIIFMSDKKSFSETVVLKIESFLGELKLKLNSSKTYICNISDGFEYLGIHIRNNSVRIENSRLERKIQALQTKTSKSNLYETISSINEHIIGFQKYYKKVVTDTKQYSKLQFAADELIQKKIVDAKISNTLTRKDDFKKNLAELQTYIDLDIKSLKLHQGSLIAKAYSDINRKNPIEVATKKIERKKQDILKNQFKASELVLTKHGLFLGFSRGKAVLKEQGKIIKSLPINRLSRVIILSNCSISSEIIYQCAIRAIDIDFISKNEPYAMISTYHQMNHATTQEQYRKYNSEQFLSISKNIIGAKIKNQVNLIKYFARYRKTADYSLYDQLSSISSEIIKIAKKLHYQKNKDVIRGIEGGCSVLYWQAFGLLVNNKDFHRTTKDAPDAINQAINYGYGILYHRVQSALLKAHLNIYAPLFHSPQENKPTLVYDAIEEFRQAVVDREIISILNRNQKIQLKDTYLNQNSVKTITQNIQKRLSGQTYYHGKKERFESVIQQQAYELAKTIKESARYKAFVCQY